MKFYTMPFYLYHNFNYKNGSALVFVEYDRLGTLFLGSNHRHAFFIDDYYLNKSSTDPTNKDAYITKGCAHLLNKHSNTKNINILKYYLKEGRNFLLNHFFNFSESKSNVEDKNSDLLNDEIRIKESFVSESGVSIDNREDGVFIKGKDSETALGFHGVLAHYFDKNNKRTVMAQSIKNLLTEDAKMKSVYGLGKAVYDLGRSDEELELLNRSRILRVYAVLKGEHGNESLLWGLAEDKNNPEKRFHWFTDLKADVSLLVNRNKL